MTQHKKPSKIHSGSTVIIVRLTMLHHSHIFQAQKVVISVVVCEREDNSLVALRGMNTEAAVEWEGFIHMFFTRYSWLVTVTLIRQNV